MNEGKTSEDFIKEANEENKRINNPPPSEGNFSKAAFSSITHPDEDDRRKKIAQGIIAELGNHTNEIDSIKQAIKTMSDQMNQLTQAFNQIASGTPQGQQGKTQALNMESISALGDLLEKGAAAYKNLKGQGAPAPSFIDPEYINEQVKASVMGNFEIGNALISNLKSKLINKAVTASVTEALKDDHNPQ